ncbi:hypothetical protein SDJN02_24348, partial [Cucurbita argyrosperma subsp. argyrosperma]
MAPVIRPLRKCLQLSSSSSHKALICKRTDKIPSHSHLKTLHFRHAQIRIRRNLISDMNLISLSQSVFSYENSCLLLELLALLDIDFCTYGFLAIPTSSVDIALKLRRMKWEHCAQMMM